MISDLGYGVDHAEVLPADNNWGFGQVIATILLLLPFISFFEVVYGGNPLAEDSPALVRRCRH